MMTDVHIAYLVITLCIVMAIFLFLLKRWDLPVRMAFLLLFYHSAITIYYFYYGLSGNPSDSFSLYEKSVEITKIFTLGTNFLIYLNYPLAGLLDIGNPAMYVIYSFFGLVGILNLLRFYAVFVHTEQRLIYNVLLLLPGLHVWSSGPGKDSISLMVISLMMYYLITYHVHKRVWALMFVFLILLLVRPHIALILLPLILVYTVKDFSGMFRYFALVSVLLMFFDYFLSYIGFTSGSFSFDTINEYISTRLKNAVSSDSLYGDAFSSAVPFYLRPIRYLVFPVDFSSGLLVAVISFENILLFFVVIFLSKSFVDCMRDVKFHIRDLLAMLVVLVAVLVMAILTYNWGIALRQKWMFLVPLFFIIINMREKICLKRIL